MRAKCLVGKVLGVFAASVLAAMGLFSVSPAMGAPSFQGLGFLDATPDDDSFSKALGVSADGLTVVGVSSSSPGTQAFLWTDSEGMCGLLDLSGGAFSSTATGVSDDGTVVVGYSTSDLGIEAFIWTDSGGMIGLGDLSGGAFESAALGVSGNGSVVVGYGTSGSGREAFRWTSAGGMSGLGDLSGGSFDSMATGVSSDGLVVTGTGHSFVSPNSMPEAFRWTSAGGMVGLGFLPDASGSYGCAISANGVTIVGHGYTESRSKTAVRWKDTDTTPVIIDLNPNPDPEGTTNTWALDVACETLAVGRQLIGFTEKNAVYFPGTLGAKNLFDKLDALGLGTDLTDWTLESANAIADDGMTIVGTGTNPDDRTEAFFSTGTFGICGFGI